ncbi:hypothetical protein [Streptomyces sp. M1013]|uniref:hypothetical protein n=1 Tax=Streptomyces sp. M1013 TaxID=549798 RepID=UPI00117FD05E|nr:hypothetical protein [Streptomyces sp. M1013]
MVFEVAGRAVNEVLPGRARHVDVTLTGDDGVRVADDGPGVPVEAVGHTGGPALETLLTRALIVPGPVDRRTAILAPCVELSGAAVRARVEAAVRERLGTWPAEHPEQADAILRRIVRRAD